MNTIECCSCDFDIWIVIKHCAHIRTTLKYSRKETESMQFFMNVFFR